MNTQSPLFKTIAQLLIVVMWAQPLHSIAANLQVDHKAGGNTHVTSAGNGVPVINIATPNGKGLSHNKFTDYNVGRQGLILNNSTDKLTQTQLGGIIFGNSQLNGKAAKTILNEVTGGQRSQLRGYTEVAGKQAHVIVANPHGITCDGCGFINTPQATLTTGKPMIEQGRLQGYDVDGGDIEIAGAGLNASNISRFDLITRSAKINAELHANQLNIVTGRNQVDADTLKATAKTGPVNEQPLLAIDSSALGGMYAGAIRLVGTEDGVGVKLAGDMAASAGDIQIDANGQLTLARVAASHDLNIKAGEIRAEQQAYAGQDLSVQSGFIENAGELLAGKSIVLSTPQLDNAGLIEAGVAADAQANTRGAVAIQAERVYNRGAILAGQELKLQAVNLDNSSGAIASGTAASIELSDTFKNTTGQIAANNLQITAVQLNNDTGMILADQDMQLTVAEQLLNRADGEIASGRKLELTAGQLNNEGGFLSSDGQLQLEANQLRNNRQAVLSAEKALDITTGSLENENGSVIVSQSGAVTLSARNILNEQSLIQSGADLSLQAEKVLNVDGQILTQGNADLHLEGAATLANQGTISADGSLSIMANHVANESALLLAGRDMNLSVNRLLNREADIYSLGSISIDGADQGLAQKIENLSASIEAGSDLSIYADRIQNMRSVLEVFEGKYFASITEMPCGRPYAGDCSISSKKGRRQSVWRIVEREKVEVLDSTAPSSLLAGGSMQLSGGELLNNSSLIASGADMQLDFSSFSNRGIKPLDIEFQRVFVSPRQRKSGYRGNQRAAKQFTDRHGSNTSTAAIERDIYRFLTDSLNYKRNSGEYVREYVADRKTIETPLGGENFSAIVQAGGSISLNARQELLNSVIKPGHKLESTSESLHSNQSDERYKSIIQSLEQRQADSARQQGEWELKLGALGANRLFSLKPAGKKHAGHLYLIETNPALTQMRQFLSSDYLLSSLGLNAEHMQKRLGDGLFEQKLIREAIIARTGQRYIAGLDSDEAMFRYLMDNAIASKDALNLSVGISLTAEQVAALTHDIVWLEEREVMGEQVLVPVLYMAQAEGRLAPNGALVQGQDLALISGGDLSNQGTLRASNSLGLQAQRVHNSGLMQAGESLSLLAEDSISNRQGGILTGRDVDLSARIGDILNERSITRHESALGNSRWETSFAASAARIEAASSLKLSAGRDVQNLGGVLQSGGDMQISAGRDVSLISAEERHGNSRGSHYLNSQTAQLISETVAGGALAIEAGRDLTAVASRVESGQDMQLVAGNDLTLAAAANESHHYSKSKKRTSQRDLVQQQGTEVVSGGKLAAVASNDLKLISSHVTASNEAYLVAGGKVQLLAEQDVDYSFYEKKKKGSFGRKSYKSDERTQVTHVGSSINSGGDLTIISGDEQRYQAAQLTSGADLTLDSGADIEFEGVKDLEQKSRIRSKNSWVWQSAKGKGHTDETLIQSQLQAQGEIAIRAAERIQIDIKEVNQQSVNQTIDAMVQADPQLAWLKDMQQRGDVDWRQVKELHDSFSYSNSGLSGPAAMVVAIVVAYFTAGAASGVIGTAAGAGAGSGSAMAAAGTATASAVASGAAVGSTVAAGWANASLSGILAGAAGGAAGAASQGQDWRDAALSGAITGGFAGYLSAGTYYNNPINTAGKITEYVGSGDWMSLSKEVSRLGMNQAFGYVQSKAAKEVGLKPEELNWALMAGSIAGNQLQSVGSRLTESNEDFYKSNDYGIRGVFNRELRGLPFDAIDIGLGYQGLPDATVQDYLSTLGLDNGLSSGHSLGTLTNIYLASNGLAEKVYLYSVPFGAVAPANAEVMIGSWDLVNGGWAGKLFNWDAEVVPLKPWEHGFENYKKHIKD